MESPRTGGSAEPGAGHHAKVIARAPGRIPDPGAKNTKAALRGRGEKGVSVSRRSALRTLGILLVVGIGFLAVAECRPGTATAFNFWRIGAGMSRAEVESILGPGAGLRPGEPASQPGMTERLIVPSLPAVDVDYTLRWVANDFSGKLLLLGFKGDKVQLKHETSPGR
jgi:hypothetical protein